MGWRVKAVFDTNILIDYFNGVHAAKNELENYTTHVISVITWMELLVGANNADEILTIKSFLTGFEVLDITQPIREKAVAIRRETRLRLPDAVILATAKHLEVALVTRNTKDFPQTSIDIRVPYLV